MTPQTRLEPSRCSRGGAGLGGAYFRVSDSASACSLTAAYQQPAPCDELPQQGHLQMARQKRHIFYPFAWRIRPCWRNQGRYTLTSGTRRLPQQQHPAGRGCGFVCLSAESPRELPRDTSVLSVFSLSRDTSVLLVSSLQWDFCIAGALGQTRC